MSRWYKEVIKSPKKFVKDVFKGNFSAKEKKFDKELAKKDGIRIIFSIFGAIKTIVHSIKERSDADI